MAPGGYFGRALVVDVGDAGTTTLGLDEAVLRTTLGGVGLGTHLLGELAPAGGGALAPAAPPAVVFSPLVGAPPATSAEFAGGAEAPLARAFNHPRPAPH